MVLEAHVRGICLCGVPSVLRGSLRDYFVGFRKIRRARNQIVESRLPHIRPQGRDFLDTRIPICVPC